MKLFYLFGLFIALSAVASAQQTITGTVVDSNGSVVKAAEVVVTILGNHGTYTAKSNDEGEYQFPDLAPANYTIKAQYAGAKSSERKIALVAGQTQQIFLILEPVSDLSTTLAVNNTMAHEPR